MCMITATAPRLDGDVSNCGALRGSTSESSANSTNACPPSSSIAPTSTTKAPPKVAATAVFSSSNDVSSSTLNMKQRIQVIVRIRPIAQTAARAAAALPDGRTLCITPVPKGAKEKLDQGRLRESRKELEAAFDRVLGEGVDQEEVYNQIKTCVRLPFSGINACVFAYGQTGSGKTYTMVGDMSQEGTESTGLLSGSTPNAGSPSAKGNAPGSSRRCEATEATAKEGRTPTSSKSKEDGELWGVGVGERAGLIPRAVEDIFRLVRQGGVEGGNAGAPLRPALRHCGFRDPLDNTPPPAAAAPPPADPSTHSSGYRSASSSRSSSSDGSSSGQIPSAAHWPLTEPTVYVPRAQTPNRAQLSWGTPPSAQSLDTDKSNTTRKGGVGEDEDDTKTLHEGSAVRATKTCKCSVQCSYMQVYNGNVYDLLSPHGSQQRPLPVLTSARLATTATGSNFVGCERDVEVHATATGEDGPSFSQREGCGVSRVKGLSVHTVDNAKQVMELLRQGGRNRRVRSTELNTHSSRSHTIVQFTIIRSTASATATALNLSSGASGCGVGPASKEINIEVQRNHPEHPEDGKHDTGNKDGDGIDGGKRSDLTGFGTTGTNGCDSGVVTTCAKLSLVDLAGSEKGRVGGEREGQKGGSPSHGEEDRAAQERERLQINASLSALSNCISCLGEAQRTHVPFRDNPLTRLLQESLLGGKTVVIATLRPSVDAQEESISTLNFAARCMRVVARQRVNEIVSETVLLERARREISALRRRLAQVETGTASTPSPPPRRRHSPPLQTVEPLQAFLETPAPPPGLDPATMKAIPISLEKRGSSDGGSDSDGHLRQRGAGGEEAAGSGGGGRHQKYRTLLAVPRDARPPERRLPGKRLAMSSKGSLHLPLRQIKPTEGGGEPATEAGNPPPPGNTATRSPPASVPEGTKTREENRRPLVGGERPVEEPGVGEPPGPSATSLLLTGAREARREGGTNTKTLLDARRGKDVVIRGRIATAVAAANAAAAAASAIVAAIGAAGGSRSKRVVASNKPAPVVPATAAVERKPRAAIKSGARKPQDGLRKTKAGRKPAHPSSPSPGGGPTAPVTRGARRSPAGAPSSPAAAKVAGRPRCAEEAGLATAALIERFSTREDELLRELEAWKARCKSFEKTEGSGGSSRSIGNAVCAGNRRRGGGISESGLRAAPAAARPTAPLAPPSPASQQTRPQHCAEACPTEDIAPKAAPGASRFARGGVEAMPAVHDLTQDRERNSTCPRRGVSAEVLQQQSSEGWWHLRLPDVQREQHFAPQSQIALGRRAAPPGGTVTAQEGEGAIDHTREGVRGQEAAAVRMASADNESSGGGSGMGGVIPLSAAVLESEAPPQTGRWAEIPSERPLSTHIDAAGNENYQGWDRTGNEKGSAPVLLHSRSSNSFLPKPQVEGVAVNPAQHLRRSTHGNAVSPQPPRQDFTEEPAAAKASATIAASLEEIEAVTKDSSSRKLDEDHNIQKRRTTIGSPLKRRPFDTESLPVAASNLALTLPPSPDQGMHADPSSTAKLDNKGCDRHGLAPCTLCGEGAYGSQRSPGFHMGSGLPPSGAETAPLGKTTAPSAGPCDRHFLADCILCKMFVQAVRSGNGGASPTLRGGGLLGRSLSLPGGGGSGSGGSLTDVPSPATRTALVACAGDRARCERHGLLGCFLCGFGEKAQAAPGPIERRGSSQIASFDSLRTNGRAALSPAPTVELPSSTSDSGDPRTGGSAPFGDGVAQPLRGSERGALGFGLAAPETDAAGGGSDGGANCDRPEKEASEIFGHPSLFGVATGEATAEAAGDAPLPTGIWGAPGVASVGLRTGDSSHPAPLTNHGGRQAENPTPTAPEHGLLAGDSAFRAVGGGRSGRHNAGKEVRGAPENNKSRRGQRHRSRGDTPRGGRGRASKASKPSGHGRTNSGSGSGRFSGSLGLPDGQKSVGNGVRGRVKHGDGDELAARALTAALAVLR